jgi:hypothetical protein
MSVSEGELDDARARNAKRLSRPRSADSRIAEVRKRLPKGVRCEICDERIAGREICVDHCHVSDRLRGFLCVRCNAGLGMFRDSIPLFARAARYLEKYGAWSAPPTET